MKQATAVRYSFDRYRVTYSRQVRDCQYRFLLALRQAGYRVRIRQDWRGRGEPEEISLK